MGPPRGRPRKGCVWQDGVGWVPVGGSVASAPSTTPVLATRVVPAPAPPSAQEIQRLMEEKEAREAAEEEARIERERLLQMQMRARQEAERREAPRRYAASLQTGPDVPVYYFDVKGNFRQLGKEPPPTQPPPPRPRTRKRRAVHGIRRVVGPCHTKTGWLCEGESEYVSD